MAARRRSGGGAGTSGGVEFQAQVAAFYGVAMLCEELAPAPLGLGGGGVIDAVRCELDAAVDDVHLILSADRRVVIQAKHTVNASPRETSFLGSALAQFAHAWIDSRDRVDTRGPMHPDRDRLLLACGPNSSKSVRLALPMLLKRLRDDPPDAPDQLRLTNTDQRKIWPLVLGHLRRVFEERDGHAPEAEELIALLSLMRVREFEFEGSERDIEQAKTLLAQAVLAQPAQAGAAWGQIVGLMLSAASGQSGLRRASLAQLLAVAGLSMLAAPSYRADVECLREETRRSRRLLGALSEIRLPSTQVKIARSAAGAALARAEEAPCLLIAEPGGGKSGVVSDVIGELVDEARDVVALLADRYTVADEAELSARLGLEHRLADVLAAWPGERKGVLVIDGLDAARGGDALAAFTSLIEDVAETGGRWTVLASIRTFDLRYNPRLQEAFRRGASTEELIDLEFASVHHLQVPRLDDGELAQVAEQLPHLGQLLDAAPDALRELVRNPFNLARLAELVEAGAPAAELRPLRTQLELLEVYWQRRVRSPNVGSDARERLARRLCENAVGALALFALRDQLASDAPADQAIAELLGAGVLVEAQGPSGAETLAFSHHVLFDYALARLMLRVGDTELAGLLCERPEFALIARPSLTLHFQWCWERDREMFWRLTFELAADVSLPLLGRLVAPAVAAQATAASELRPLTQALSEPGPGRMGARAALVHVIGAALAGGSQQRPLQNARVDVWSEFADQLSEQPDEQIVTNVRILTWGLLEERERLGDQERAAIGRVGRRLLRRALQEEISRGDLVYVGLNAVAGTFDTDPAGSRELLAEFVTRERISARGWEELHWIIEVLFGVMAEVPDLVGELYASAFGVTPPGDTTVPMGGPVMPLSSTQSQDFGVALYSLGERYGAFLEAASGAAVGALIDVCVSFAERRPWPAPETSERVRWRGEVGRVIDDYSLSWDQGSAGMAYRDEEKMLNAYQQRLEELSAAADIVGAEALLYPLAGRDVPAVIWRRILNVAARHPQQMGPLLAEVLASQAILAAMNTNGPAATALTACFQFLSENERKQIEQAILELPADEEFARRRREQLLTALPERLIVTDAAREQRPTTLAEREDDDWEPPSVEDPGGRPSAEPAGDQSDDRTALATLTAPVQALAQGTEPSGIDWTRAAEDVRALRGGIATLQVDGQQREEAEGWLTLASVRVAARNPLPADDATALAAELLLTAATDPRPDQEDDLASFDRFPSWGFPAGRVDAARGLIALAREPDRLPDGALDALQTLAEDRAAAVRLRVAEHLGVLASTHADLAWQFADQLARDPSAAVRQALLGSFGGLAADDRDRALELVVRVSREESTRAAPQEGLLTAAACLLTECWVWQGAPQGHTLLEEVVGDLGAYAEIAPRLTFALRNPTTYGEVGAEDPNADAVRARAIGAFTSLARAGLAAFQAELDAYQATAAAGGPVDEKPLKAAGNLVDHACTELYFASGAYQNSRNEQQPRVSEAQRERFYHEASELIDTLCDAPLPRAAHHVMQTLERSIELDPRGVMLRTGRVLQAAHVWHYAHDQMALALFINITQRYLAEHRELLTDAECRTSLLKSLEFFVIAGWPAARRLVYRLDEAFR
jgi:hypothetical protein